MKELSNSFFNDLNNKFADWVVKFEEAVVNDSTDSFEDLVYIPGIKVDSLLIPDGYELTDEDGDHHDFTYTYSKTIGNDTIQIELTTVHYGGCDSIYISLI